MNDDIGFKILVTFMMSIVIVYLDLILKELR